MTKPYVLIREDGNRHSYQPSGDFNYVEKCENLELFWFLFQELQRKMAKSNAIFIITFRSVHDEIGSSDEYIV